MLSRFYRLMSLIILAIFVLVAVAELSGAEILIQTVDGLNRPVPGVQIEVSCVSTKDQFTSFHFESDDRGAVHGTYDRAKCKPPFFVHLKKEGYQSYSSGYREQYVVRRQFNSQELLRVLELDGDSQQRELRELLAGDFAQEQGQFLDLVFRHESRLRPVLRALVRDPDVTISARDLLAMIGASEDLQLMMQLPPPPPVRGFPERWRYRVASALVNPDSEDEWAFLRRCALNEFKDLWVVAGAVQTLKLTATARSRELLEEAQTKNPARASRISTAISYIDSSQPPLVDADLDTLAERSALALNLGKWKGNGKPRFNEAGDKALVDFTFQTSTDRYGYTATFHKMDGLWRLRGAHETYQAFAPLASSDIHPVPKKNR